MTKIHYNSIEGRSIGFGALFGLFLALTGVGLGASYYMEHHGHVVTGMNNYIVWGTPHVFAVFLIVAASGALNVASIASVFGRAMYKPLSRLSALLSVALLAGGLAVLVLDLGRPDRMIVAMTYYNFKSIFAWNIFLYTGFFAIVAIYLWVMFQPALQRFSKTVGVTAFIWRLVLTTGTGSIFGFLVARQGYDAAIMAPMFIIMSFAFGLAIFILVLMAAYRWSGRELGDAVLTRLKNLLGVFVAAVFYFTLVYHLTNLYATEHHGVERFILLDGGIYTQVFWIGQILVGAILPLLMLYTPIFGRSRFIIGLASTLVVIGGIAQLYVILIGGQAYPLDIFPGMEVTSTAGFGKVIQYSPSLPEILLGISGIGIAMALLTFAIKILPFLPVSLADQQIDPHFAAKQETKPEASGEAVAAGA